MQALTAALTYAARGWPVLPIHTVADGLCSCGRSDCHSPGKHPRTDHGVKDASTDPAALTLWWRAQPSASVAVATGGTFVVLDVDPRNGGDRTLEILIRAHGPLPQTLECSTGGGGRHLYFSVSEPTRSKKLGDGLDFQGLGKYVVAAPSVHVSGRAYAWANDLPLAPLPAWLASLTAIPSVTHESSGASPLSISESDRHRRAVAYLRTMDPAISGAGGHQALWRASVALVKGFALDGREALQVLATEYNPRCQPPWTKRELEHKVRDAAGASLSVGYLLAEGSGGPPPMPERRDDVAVEAPRMVPADLAQACAEVAAVPLVERYVATVRAAKRAGRAVAAGLVSLEAARDALLAASGLLGTASEAEARKAVTKALERAMGRAAVEAPDGAEWQAALLRKPGKVELLSTAANVVSILSHHDDWRGVLAYDEHRGVITTLREPPWHADDRPSVEWEPGAEWSDADDTRAQAWLQRSEWALSVGRDTICTAVEVAARRNTIHPVRDWLRSLSWDGVQRLDTWGVRYLRCEDTPHARRVCRWWLMSAVARAIEPGCQVDYTLVLEGEQEAGKTSALRILGGKWFAELDGDLQGKDPVDRIHGVWIAELSEFSSMSRTEEAALKGFLTRRVDRVRLAYARRAATLPRGCVFGATINPDSGGYLRDPTGNRRYWPITVGAVDVAALAADRDQLFAEALSEVDDGRPWWPDRSYRDELREVVAERETVDPWQPIVERYLRARVGQRVDVTDLLTDGLGIAKGLLRQGEKSRAITCAKRVGWVYRRLRDESGARMWALVENPDVYGSR